MIVNVMGVRTLRYSDLADNADFAHSRNALFTSTERIDTRVTYSSPLRMVSWRQ